MARSTESDTQKMTTGEAAVATPSSMPMMGLASIWANIGVAGVAPLLVTGAGV